MKVYYRAAYRAQVESRLSDKVRSYAVEPGIGADWSRTYAR